MRLILALCAAALCALPASATVVLPKFFTDSMVVQHATEITIPGTAKRGATVKVTPSWGETVKTKAAKDGSFSVTLRTPDAGGPYSITFDDGKPLTLNDILAGEVWLCSGQSNMEMPVEGWGKVMDYRREVANADYPDLRLLQVKKATAYAPQADAEVNMGGWRSATPESVANFSAIGYFFGRELNQRLGVPVGIIDCTWGGTPIEAWSAYQTLKGQGEFPDELDKIDRYLASGANADLEPAPGNFRYPTVLYNAMLHPLAILPVEGVLWYQGCSNVGRADQYARLFPAMIADWRQDFGNPDMPFLFAQLSAFQQPKRIEPESGYAALRQAQKETLAVPNTAMVVTIDLGNPDDIHPKNKQEVARRFALAALNNVYHRKQAWRAPDVETVDIDGRYVRITFDGDIALYGGGQGFIVKGPDGRWAAGYGRQVADNAIEVSSDEIDTPVEVRYAWADYPEVGLRSLSGLPVSPFTTAR